MGLKKIKLDDIDIKYLTTINDAMTQIENRILALELTKLEIYEELKKIKTRYQDYSAQLKEKYNIPATNAEIDLDEKMIVFEIDEIKEEEKKEEDVTTKTEQIGGAKKTKQVPKMREQTDI